MKYSAILLWCGNVLMVAFSGNRLVAADLSLRVAIRHASLLFLIGATGMIASGQPTNAPRLVYATYVGTGPTSLAYGIAVDSSGYAYATGTGLDSHGTPSCAFLTKLNQSGTAAVWSRCLPVTQLTGIALDTSGYIYVAGVNQVQPFNGGMPSFSTIMKLSPDGQQTVYSISIVGTYVTKLVLDRAGNVYTVGWADATFKPTPGAYLSTPMSAFVEKLNNLGAIQYATFVDFLHGLYGIDLAIDSMGHAWVVGAGCAAFSCAAPYGLASAIRELDASGSTALVKQNFGGGRGDSDAVVLHDSALGVAVDSTDSVWVVGVAESSLVPTTPGAIEPQRIVNGGSNGYVNGIGYALKLSPSGKVLYGTYVGTTPPSLQLDHTINSVAVDAQGRPYFALNAPDMCGGAASEVVALSSDGSSLLFSTIIGSPVDRIALDGNGGLYTLGNTPRVAFLTTLGAYQMLYPGGFQSGYAARFDLTQAGSASHIDCLVNAASLPPPGSSQAGPLPGTVAPGEIVTIFGNDLPTAPKLTFDGYLAPILYADSYQINAVVPFEIGSASTVAVLEGVGQYTLPVLPALPALFTVNGGGSAQLAALNQDGTVNSKANPAKAGSVVSVYMTGVGAMKPGIGDGALGPLRPPYPVPALGVSATVNGVAAPVLFAGQAPGLIAGAVQVNIGIPSGASSGAASLVVYIGNYRTQVGTTTVAVQ